jgi:hypothetical protein
MDVPKTCYSPNTDLDPSGSLNLLKVKELAQGDSLNLLKVKGLALFFSFNLTSIPGPDSLNVLLSNTDPTLIKTSPDYIGAIWVHLLVLLQSGRHF